LVSLVPTVSFRPATLVFRPGGEVRKWELGTWELGKWGNGETGN